MADPTPTIAQGKQANKLGGASGMMFPADLTSAPYYTKIRFVKYDRKNPSSLATEQSAGTIHLPIPLRLPEAYTINYNGMALGTWGGVATNFDTGVNTVEKMIAGWQAGHGIGDILKAGADTTGIKPTSWKAAMAILPKAWADGQAGAALGRFAGAVPNPHLTTIFEGVALRNFELEWRLSPRSAQESRDLLNIERFIKRHSHPAFTEGTLKFALDYPDEVYVDFVGTDYLEPIKKSVVTHISLEKADNGPAFYKAGAPVFYTLRLALMEVEIRTAEDWGTDAAGPSQGTGETAGASTDPSVKR